MVRLILVSACMAGIRCRYDGRDNRNETAEILVMKGYAIPLCPEQLGGMTTPRVPCEICKQDGRVYNRNGDDKTECFIKGANETSRLVRIFGITSALLQERSPSCGVNFIYDGTFRGVLVTGMGKSAKKLSENGIKIFCLNDIHSLLERESINSISLKRLK